jgi:hypothetical protein
MADSRGSANDEFHLEPQEAQRLRQACPDLHDWPRSWHVEPADIVVGQQVVELLTPFILHLLDQGLAKATVSRHRDNLWTLGGELIRRPYDNDELAQQDVKAAIAQLIGPDGGPLVWPRITEAEQDSLDATCRKLDRFWRAAGAADATS